jgi:hypothetical protein
MSRGGNVRRDWTHRRLGLGAMRPSEAQLTHADALLTAVGGRDGGSIGSDPFAAALLDFAYDVDLVVGIADLEAQPIPVEQLRLAPAPARRRRPTWSVLIPAMGTALAAIVVAATVLIGRGNPVVVSPTATATVESHQLLRHADELIADATKAAPAARKRLVSEARADLAHVTHLLPLTPNGQRPALRRQLLSLEQQVAPPPPPARSSAQGSRSGRSGSTGSGANGSGSAQAGSGQGASTVGPGGGSGSSGTTGSSSGTPIGSGSGTGAVLPPPLPTNGSERPLPPPVRTGPGGAGAGAGATTGGKQGTVPSTPPTRPLPPPGSGGGGRQGPPGLSS